MNKFKRIAALLLALMLCIAAAVPAFATETGGETPNTEQTNQGTQPSQPENPGQEIPPSQPEEPGQETQPSQPEEPGQETEPTQPETGWDPGGRDFDVEFTEVSQTVYAVAHVNVRKGPGVQFKITGHLSYGDVVTRIGICENGWSMVLYGDEVCYVFSAYLTMTKPENLKRPIDDSALLQQMAIANGLNRSDYTRASWEVLFEALINATQAANGDSQQAADEAVALLQQAIATLVPMDYSRLIEALAELDRLAQTDDDTALWNELMRAAYDARDLLTSGNQPAVDELAARLQDLMRQVRDNINTQQTPNIVVQEVPVEVPPTEDFCNIPMHRVWPVLFFISLALNVALAAVIILYIYRKHKNQQDDTPLVDYDIEDDMF